MTRFGCSHRLGLALLFGWALVAMPAAAANLDWLIQVPGFSRDACFAFPRQATGLERAVVACVRGDGVRFGLAFAAGRRWVEIDLGVPVAAADLVRIEGQTFLWQPDYYYEFVAGQPAIPVAEALLALARAAPADTARAFVGAEGVLAMQGRDDETRDCSPLAIVVPHPPARLEVGCVDSALSLAAAAKTLGPLAKARGNLVLEAWDPSGRHLLGGAFHRSIGAPPTPVFDQARFLGRLRRASERLILEPVEPARVADVYPLLRIALVLRQPRRLAELARLGFIQSPEIYLLDVTQDVSASTAGASP